MEKICDEKWKYIDDEKPFRDEFKLTKKYVQRRLMQNGLTLLLNMAVVVYLQR